MAPEGEPASQCRPESEHGPEAEFHIPDRMSLLKTLKDALNATVQLGVYSTRTTRSVWSGREW